MIRMTWWCMGGVAVFLALLFAMIVLARPLIQTHFYVYVALWVILIGVYLIALFTFIILSNRRQRQIREEEKARKETDRH